MIWFVVGFLAAWLVDLLWTTTPWQGEVTDKDVSDAWRKICPEDSEAEL